MARLRWHRDHHRRSLIGDPVNIDPAAVLALLSSLTQQVAALTAENEQLRAALAESANTE